MNNFILTDKGVIDSTKDPSININTDRSVYEVIRLIDGVALFLEDHFDRLIASAHISGIQLNMQFSDFSLLIDQLMSVNQQYTGNIKFLLIVTNGNNHWLLSFIPHSYPTQTDYELGVTSGLLDAERLNPEAKMIQNAVRKKADQMIADKKLYEVLLVDRNGFITEGSRSNVFFVKEGIFYTASATMVLSGVTRKKVLDCLREMNYTVLEQAVSADKVGNYEAVFLTGTSPKVLPVNAIDDCRFYAGNPLVNELMDFYNRKINEYILSKKV